MSPANELRLSLAALRRQWRQRVLLEGLAWVAASLVLAVLLAWLVGRAFAGGGATLLVMRAGGYSLIAATLAWCVIRPLTRRASDLDFALYVEEHAPELHQALLASVQQLGGGEAEPGSPALARRLIDRTLALVRPLQADGRIERPRMRRASRAFGAVAVVALLLLGFGPDDVRSVARTLFVPWATAEAAAPLVMRVVPGDATVPRGASVDVTATAVGFAPDDAELVFRSDTAGPWIRLPMSAGGPSGEFTSRLFDLVQATDYYVEARGVRSALHRLRVADLPAVSSISVRLDFPAYTGLPDEVLEDRGDVAAIVGTTAVVTPRVTKPVKGGTIAFDDGTRVPLVVGADGSVTGTFRVRTSGFYRVDLVADDGSTVPGSVSHAVEALPDRAPTVAIDEPGRDTKVTSLEEVAVAVRAADDHGVTRLELRYRVNGGAEQRIVLGSRVAKEPRAVHTLFLEEHALAPGDLVAYHAWARDAVGNAATSDIYFLEVRPFGKDYRAAEQQGGGGGGGGESPEGFVPRQREIIAGTFNWIRDSAATDGRRRREDMATLHIAEGRLREDVAALARRLVQRGAAGADSAFGRILVELEAAVAALENAEQQLVRGNGQAALAPEQQALQRLQRAEAMFRDVQVQLGGTPGGGGGGGGSQDPEQLADLFELERDKQRNQYEAVQQSPTESPSAAAADSALERLRELARRQQQENERMQRLADAMRERLGRESQGGGGGGAGASQRSLAREAEEEARRLERLSRERQAPELAQAAEQLRRAAESMRRASAGQETQGAAAAEELQRATRRLEGARRDRAGESVQDLARRAEALEARQRAIAEGVRALPGAAGAERERRLQDLDRRKAELGQGIEGLEAAAEEAARAAAREQPRAAAQVNEGAEAIRDRRIQDKVRFSRNVMRGGSPEYANALEGQIAENLQEVTTRMRAAGRALGAGTASSDRDERALERTRELVRAMESLRDRASDARAGGQPGGEREGEGREGREGEGGQGGGQARDGQAAEGRGGQPGETSGGDARQLSREVSVRRRAAEALRDTLRRQGANTRELDDVIGTLRRLEQERAVGTPQGIATLERDVIAGLKEFEFGLYRRLGLASGKGPAQGSRAPIPPEYRAAVEEYYRSLARSP